MQRVSSGAYWAAAGDAGFVADKRRSTEHRRGLRRQLLVHYALEFELPREQSATSIPWKLHLEADANAFVTLNGHLLGRYWAVGPSAISGSLSAG